MTVLPQKNALPLLFLFLVSLMVTGCKEITMEDLETRHGVTYVKGSKTPFTGMVKSYYSSESDDPEDRKVFREGSYLEGYKNDKWMTYKWDGGRIETPYKSGRIEGIVKTFYSTGEPKREQRFFDGKPHGNDIHFSKDNVRTLQIFYRHGVPGAPPPSRKAEIKMEEEEIEAAQKRDERLFGKRNKSWMEHVLEMF
ncbi:MAG: hypothetical protein HQL72_09765 [Magnetococcales bacterium]|nr:hypothetical protein [Magnetococcales bacterium]